MVSKMDNNSTNHSSQNVTLSSDVDVLMMVAVGVCFLMCLWVIILNGLLVVCFQMNQRESWFAHSKNILTVIIIDFFVGVATLMALLSSMKTNVNIYECIVTMSICVASQTATSLNVFRFCVIRFYTVRRSTVVQEPSTKVIVSQTLVIWIASSIVVTVPLILWSDRELVIDRCIWGKLFATNNRNVNIYMFQVLVIPTLATSILYGTLTVHLRKMKNLIHPSSSTTQEVSDSKLQMSAIQMSGQQTQNKNLSLKHHSPDRKFMKGSVPSKPQAWTHLNQNSFSAPLSDVSDSAGPSLRNFTRIDGQDISNGSSFCDTDIRGANQSGTSHGAMSTNATAISNIKSLASATKGYLERASNHVDKDANRRTSMDIKPSRHNRMAKVTTTIGIILLLANISILPYILVLAVQFASPGSKIPSVFGFVSLFFLLLNSATNPVIYAIRLKPLRTAFVGMYKQCCCFFCR